MYKQKDKKSELSQRSEHEKPPPNHHHTITIQHHPPLTITISYQKKKKRLTDPKQQANQKMKKIQTRSIGQPKYTIKLME